MDYEDFYGILGLTPNAEKKVIQQTFLQLARKEDYPTGPRNVTIKVRPGALLVITAEKRPGSGSPQKDSA
jgi:hypothetical protein